MRKLILCLFYCYHALSLYDKQACLNLKESIKKLKQTKQGLQKDIPSEDYCSGFDQYPFPFLTGACHMYQGVKTGNVGDLVLGIFNLGMATYTNAKSSEVSDLARKVQKGGKIKEGVMIGNTEYKSLRWATRQLRQLQAINIDLARNGKKYSQQIQNIKKQLQKNENSPQTVAEIQNMIRDMEEDHSKNCNDDL